ncbi:MAG: FtsW/RodA/SpoVE family cell cycle protein [Actinomycetales bacterium]|nr:FtsW/RodA/SpoVE family cell cycle protein [Actinomycetales bacterium]
MSAAPTLSPDTSTPARKQPTRRNVELVLLVFAWAIGLLGTLQISWAIGEDPSSSLWITAGVVGFLALVMHGVTRWKAPYADPFLLPVSTLLTLLGLVMIYRLDVAAARRAELNGNPAPTPDVFSQLTWFTVAVILFVSVLVLLRDHRILQRYTYTLGLAGLILLVLPLAPVIGTTVNGATLWIRVFGFSFQPAELAKILLTIFFAGYLVEKRDSLALVRTKVLGIGFPRVKDLGPIIIAWLVSLAVLIFERDLGTSLLFFGLFVSMLYIATQRRSWLLLGGVLFAIGAVLAYYAFGHVRLRVTVWLDPWTYAGDQGYQIVQSLFGLANGGILGAGLGQGFPNLVPFANTDFIVAALGEELGLTGLIAILLLYAILVERGLRTAISVRDSFGQLVAAGLSVTMALQVFVIIGGVTRLIPLTGLTTPFLSYGGSSLIANWILVALLLRISDRARRPDLSAPSPDDAVTQVVRRV